MWHGLSSVDVAILAGGVNTIALFEGYTPGYKAVLPICGKPLLRYTLDALRGIPHIRRVCIVGPEPELRSIAFDPTLDRVCEFVPSGETLLESVTRALQHLASTHFVLVATADTPLLTKHAIEEFLTACTHIQTPYVENVYLSVVPARCFTGMYRQVTKAFNRFRDITVCHGNLALVTPGAVAKAAAPGRLNALYAARKKPVSAALAVGWQVGLSYLLGVHFWPILTMDQMSRIASRRFGVGLMPVILERPEVALDVDEIADYRLAEMQLMA